MMRKAKRIAHRAGVVMLLLVAPAMADPAVGVTDALGRTVTVSAAQRIITLGSDVTEIVYALDAGDRIVAVDRGSRFPADTATKSNVGYRRQLSVEGLLSLDPDLILAAEDIGPPEAVDVLRALDVAVVFVPQDDSGEGIRGKIDLISATLTRQPQGEVLAAEAVGQLESAAALTSAIPPDRRKKVVFLHGLVRLTAAGADTAADAIIRLAGGVNPMDEVKGYKAASEEKLIELAPDVILMMSDGKGGPTPDEVFSNRALAATPAGQTRSLIVRDGAYMIGFGPRTAEVVMDLANALYGEALPSVSD